MHNYSDFLQLQLSDAKDMIKKFSKLDKNKDGTLEIHEFADLLGVPNCGYTRDLFRYMEVCLY